MRVRAVALWSMLGMVFSSAAAMAIPLPRATSGGDSVLLPEPPPSGNTGAHFTAGDTLTLDARLGHPTLRKAPGGAGETFLFASVTGAEVERATPAPVHMAIVIDSSGSMEGKRFANAKAAATGILDRMRDGDTVTVVAFQSFATVVVPPTPVTPSTRADIASRIRALRVGGGTCISCGIDQAVAALERSERWGGEGFDRGPSVGRLKRIMLLSDGEATNGIRDIPGMRSLAARVRDRGVSITTIGVDVHFDEKMMTAIAVEGNGGHYFVSDPSGLPAVFAQELETLTASVASDAELVVDLAPGVEVEEVFDRSFRTVRTPEGRSGGGGAKWRSGGTRVLVPFGPFSRGEEKTVLLRLRVPTGHDGNVPVADVSLAYRDLVKGGPARCSGSLAVVVNDVGSDAMDPFVAARLERSRTAKALTEANRLFEEGNVDEARAMLARQQQALRAAQSKASATPAPVKVKGRALTDDFSEQERVLAEASSSFGAPMAGLGAGVGRAAAPAPASPESHAGRAAVRSNAQGAFELSR